MWRWTSGNKQEEKIRPGWRTSRAFLYGAGEAGRFRISGKTIRRKSVPVMFAGSPTPFWRLRILPVRRKRNQK
jgi:hypothetical protein